MSSEKDKGAIRQLATMITSSKSIVFFGGAGVSTESGIPDYRSENGLYAAREAYGFSPEQLLSHTVFINNPSLFFRYYRENLIARDAQPNAAHLSLAQLEAMGKLKAVITQNVDGLHQAAGSRVVYELHGSNWRQYCLGCGAEYTLDYILDVSNCDSDGFTPLCAACGNIVRPDVVLYEEPLDTNVMSSAIQAIDAADMLIVSGTSLAVYPAAGLVRYFNGSRLVLINKTATPLDSSAQLVINAAVGEVFTAVMQLL